MVDLTGKVSIVTGAGQGIGRAYAEALAEVGATVAREGIEFGVTSRELAVGGQLVSIRGLIGEYSDLFLPLFGSYQAGNAITGRLISFALSTVWTQTRSVFQVTSSKSLGCAVRNPKA